MATDPEARLVALQVAIGWNLVHGHTQIKREVFDLAESIINWADPAVPAALIISVDQVTYDQDGPSQTQTVYGGGKVQLNDNQQVTLSVTAVDTKGQPVTEDAALAWSLADGSVAGIVSITPAADNMSCLVVAGNVGTGAVVTVGDGNRTATMSFDTIPGDLAALNITAGTPEDQPPAAPAGP